VTLTVSDILIAVILTVKVAITQPCFVNTLMYQGTLELIAATAAAYDRRMIAVTFVRHVHTVIVTVTAPR